MRNITTDFGTVLTCFSRRRRFSGLLVELVIVAFSTCAALAHDIPNQRVDRSIQVTLSPGRLTIDYEVSLSELTLTQDLLALTGKLPGGDRSSWLTQYAQVTGPLDAKGIFVATDGQPIELSLRSYDLVVEEHPRYTFHFESAIPNQGKLSVRDRNYALSEGTSRLAVRGRQGVTVVGDELPGGVEQISIRPVWQLSDAEERRTRQVEVRFARTKQANLGVRGEGNLRDERLGQSQAIEENDTPRSGRALRMPSTRFVRSGCRSCWMTP